MTDDELNEAVKQLEEALLRPDAPDAEWLFGRADAEPEPLTLERLNELIERCRDAEEEAVLEQRRVYVHPADFPTDERICGMRVVRTSWLKPGSVLVVDQRVWDEAITKIVPMLPPPPSAMFTPRGMEDR